MEIGIDSFAGMLNQEKDPIDATTAMHQLLERIVLADKSDVDVFGIGEHHRKQFLDASPITILSAAAAMTSNIRLTTAVAVLSAKDPVRLFQEAATLDLISKGRAELVVGRGSSVEAFPLFGYDLAKYDEIFAEKLDLLLQIRENEFITWSGKYRPALRGLPVYPRPTQAKLPIWLGVGGTPQSFVRAGQLGLPLMVAIIGGETRQFRPLVDLYRKAWAKAGHPEEELRVGLHEVGFVANTTQDAIDGFYPDYVYNMNKLGKERGFPPMTRDRFDYYMGKQGSLLVGSPQDVAEKIKLHSEELGGVSRVTFQMDMTFGHEKLMNAIELIGTQVKPLIANM